MFIRFYIFARLLGWKFLVNIVLSFLGKYPNKSLRPRLDTL